MQNVTSERMVNSDELQELKLWKEWAKQIKRFQDKNKVVKQDIKKAA